MDIKNNKEWLTRAECSALRGIAILMIVLHNYCHWLGFAVKENEYTFSEHNNNGLMNILTNPDQYLPVHLFSYFGHYGVQIFLFLSGFGLVMKYERDIMSTKTSNTITDVNNTTPMNSNKAGSIYSFIRFHYLKLFRMMIVGFVAFTIFDIMTPGTFQFHAENVIAQMLMIINVLPTPDKIIWPGPYWFFGLMLQLYIIYRCFIYRRHYSYMIALVIICWMLQIFCDVEGETLNRLRYNCIGGVLAFCLGVAAARLSKKFKNYNGLNIASTTAIYITSTAILFFMCFNYQAWLLAPIMLIISSIAFIKLLPSCVTHRLEWVGGISAAMFVAHPVLRKLFIPISRHGDVYDGIVLYIITTIAISWIVNLIINKIPKPKL